METIDLKTPHGLARAFVTPHGSPRGLLVMCHGAGGGVDAPDLLAVTDRAHELGWVVARVEQPYRVAGRRAPAPAKQLDANWIAIVEQLRERVPAATPVVVGGRSMGGAGGVSNGRCGRRGRRAVPGVPAAAAASEGRAGARSPARA